MGEENAHANIESCVIGFLAQDVNDALLAETSAAIATTWRNATLLVFSMIQHPFLNASSGATWSFEPPADSQEQTQENAEDEEDTNRGVSTVGLQSVLTAVAFRLCSYWNMVEQGLPHRFSPLCWLELSNLRLEDRELLDPAIQFIESLSTGLPWLHTLNLEGNYLSDQFATRLSDLWKDDVTNRNRQRRVFASRFRRSVKLQQSTLMHSSVGDTLNASLHSGSLATDELLPTERGEVFPSQLVSQSIGDDGAFAIVNALNCDGSVAPH